MHDEIVMKAPQPGAYREVYMNRGKRYAVDADGLVCGVEPCDVATLRATGFRVVDRRNSDECL